METMVRMGKQHLLRCVKAVEGMTLEQFQREINALRVPNGGFETSLARESGVGYFLYGANGAEHFQRKMRVYIRDSEGRCIKIYDVRNYE